MHEERFTMGFLLKDCVMKLNRTTMVQFKREACPNDGFCVGNLSRIDV